MGKTDRSPGGPPGATEFSRRRVIDLGLKALAGGRIAASTVGSGIRYASWRVPIALAAYDQESKMFDHTKTETTLVIPPEQRERFKSKEFEKYKNVVLVVGGATVQNSDEVANAISP